MKDNGRLVHLRAAFREVAGIARSSARFPDPELIERLAQDWLRRIDAVDPLRQQEEP